MHRIPGYVLLFLGLLVVQVFLLENLMLGVWIHPLVYVGFVVLLPMEMRGLWVLVLGLMMGLAVDFLTGGMGLHTIGLLAAAFTRRVWLILMLGRETVGDGGAPCSARIGGGKFLRYASMVVATHCVVFFFFEAFGVGALWVTLAKIACSAIVTMGLVWVVQMFFRR